MAENVGSISYDVSLDTSNLVRGQRDAESSLKRVESSFNSVAVAVKIYAAALALVKTAQIADDLRLLAARVDVAAGSAENGAKAMRSLEEIARRTQTTVAANAEVFGRLNQSLLQMGGTQEDTLKITELLGKAVKVSGASAQESSSAMLQFGQALGSGKLAGDELRSLLENAPYLMRQLAEGIGVPVGALKDLGEQGKLTSDVVINALTKASSKINADFAKLPQTLSASMDVTRDAFSRLVAEIEKTSNHSAVLTGLAKGLGQAFDGVVSVIQRLNGQQTDLNRNNQVEAWANATVSAVSYVVDGIDFVIRGFKQTGTLIGGLAASSAAVARGELESAKAIASQTFADVKALGAGQYAGASMRQQRAALATGTDGSDRLDRMARAPAAGSKLKPTVSDKDKDKKKGKPSVFDTAGYLAGLRQTVAEESEKINIIEAEAIRKAQELRDKGAKDGGISQEAYETARYLIMRAAAQSRMELGERESKRIQDQVDAENREKEKLIADDKRRQDEMNRNRQAANQVLDNADPVTALRAELQAKSELMTQYAQIDQDNALLYEAAKVQLAKDTAEKIKAIEDKIASDRFAGQQMVLSGYEALFGAMSGMAETFGGKQSATYRVLFAAQKGFAIAAAILNIQKGMSDALASGITPTQKIAAMSMVASSGASILASIRGANYGGGRQYGGPVTADNLYRVNETGRPEMFTASNGTQYMMPTSSGRVTSADKVSGGPSWNIVVNNNAPGAQASATVDEQGRTVTIAIAQVADQIRSNSGPVWSALRSSTNVAPRI